MKSEKNAAVILSVLRHEVESRDAIINAAAPVTTGASSPFEFEIQNPTAYPRLPSLDSEGNERHFGKFDSFS